MRMLTEDSVRSIRAMSANGSTNRELADHYGVDFQTIRRILNGESWSSVK